jgi:hypothetical protein
MKPIKNRFHCIYSGRVKMLFKTEKKANNFMKFNNDTIESENGYKPVRAYFCICCNGWHLTSKQLTGKKTVNKVEEIISPTIHEKKVTKSIIKEINAKKSNEDEIEIEVLSDEPTIRLIKICEEYKIGMAELILIFKNHNIFIKPNPNSKVALIDLEEIKYRLK